ncbi:MAG: Flp pilus assembly protein CpaB [Planctomycetia bacterium]|nr:Flp pilus assembly protein CpaB [Planctomycetia bacterium]
MSTPGPTTVMLGICAILFGLATAYAVHVKLSESPGGIEPIKAPEAKPAPAQPMATVVFSKVNIPPNTPLTEDNLQTYQVPFEELKGAFKGAFTRKEMLLGRVTKVMVPAVKMITEKEVYPLGEVPTLVEKLREGETALTIPVSVVTSVAGYLQPDSLVNIALTVSGDSHPELPDKTTVTLLKNVRILATSEDLFPYNPSSSKNMSNITIAAPQDVANKLIVAQQYGTLSVTLAPSTEGAELEVNQPMEDRTAPLDLFGLEAPVPEYDWKVSADMWISTRKRTNQFTNAEVLESINATQVADGLPTLRKLPATPEALQTPEPSVQ